MTDPCAYEQFVEATLQLSEHLFAKSRAVVADPLIAQMRSLVSRRFKVQKTYWRATRALRRTVYPFQTAYNSLYLEAYNGGADIAGGELGVLVEAERKRKFPYLRPRRTGGDLEHEIDRTTEARIQDLAHQAAAEGATSIAALQQKIIDLFDDWSRLADDSRSSMIASTEVARGIGEGMTAAAAEVARQDPTVEILKEWWAEPDACDICEDNAGDGKLPEDMPFASGNQAPPAHPNCRCSLIMSRSDNE